MSELIPKISVIIPCYNAERYIQETIESILIQKYPQIEIIVVDDGSKDGSIEKLTPYLDHITLIQQENAGACVARNRGLEVATGELIKFLDADDYLLPGVLKRQAEKIQELADNEIVFGDLIQKFPDREVLRRYRDIPQHEMIEALILTGVLTSLPLHRKELLKNVGGFDPRFKNGQEWNLHIRLAASGVKFIYQPGVVYHQRFHDGADRISNQKCVTDVEYQIQKRLMTLDSIAQFTPLTDSIKQTMAFNLWRFGRKCLLEDDSVGAQQFFQASRAITPNIGAYFSKGHNLLNKMIGAERSEKLIYYRKRFTKFRRRLLGKEA